MQPQWRTFSPRQIHREELPPFLVQEQSLQHAHAVHQVYVVQHLLVVEARHLHHMPRLHRC